MVDTFLSYPRNRSPVFRDEAGIWRIPEGSQEGVIEDLKDALVVCRLHVARSDVSIEDQPRAVMLFDNGAVADVTWSHGAAIGKPLWRILGTKGAILDTGAGGNVGYQEQISGPVGGSFQMVSYENGERNETEVPYKESDWLTYYIEIADHLLRGRPVPVSGEDGRRTIAVLEAAERSAKSGKTEAVEYE